jgi:hypothetical protein
LVNSFTMFLSKGFENPLFVYLAIPIFIGELSFCLWLLIKGIDTSKRQDSLLKNKVHEPLTGVLQ